MHTEEQTKHSILTVSGKKELLPLVRRSLQNECIISAEYANDAASARRCILDRYYTIVVINSPLQGESGVELAIDTACQCSASILLIVPGAIYAETIERVADFGILVIEKPFPVLRLNRAMHFLSAQQTRLQKLEEKVRAAEEKVQEIMLVDKAKFFLMEHRHMTEAEAHRYIGKQAMNHGMSRKRIAQEILDDE